MTNNDNNENFPPFGSPPSSCFRNPAAAFGPTSTMGSGGDQGLGQPTPITFGGVPPPPNALVPAPANQGVPNGGLFGSAPPSWSAGQNALVPATAVHAHGGNGGLFGSAPPSWSAGHNALVPVAAAAHGGNGGLVFGGGSMTPFGQPATSSGGSWTSPQPPPFGGGYQGDTTTMTSAPGPFGGGGGGMSSPPAVFTTPGTFGLQGGNSGGGFLASPPSPASSTSPFGYAAQSSPTTTTSTSSGGGRFGGGSAGTMSDFGGPPFGHHQDFATTDSAAATGGFFGAPAASTTSSPFGSTGPNDGFAASTSGSAFGSTMSAGSNNSTFQGVPVSDFDGISTIEIFSITALSEYEGMSLEEIRLQDMLAGRYRTGTAAPPPLTTAAADPPRVNNNNNHNTHEHQHIFKPAVPYPFWDPNWDGRERLYASSPSPNPRVRRILLVRHGQYEINASREKDRTLTPLGRTQASLTGKRLAQLVKTMGIPIKIIRVSNLTRAKETANIIKDHLPGVRLGDPDPMLNETLPAVPIPMSSSFPSMTKPKPQAEAAFRKYFSRPSPEDDDTEGYELMVFHGNLIRYMFCRVLQFPPEAFHRLALAHCSITGIEIVSSDGGKCTCRGLGDMGHLEGQDFKCVSYN